MGVPGIGDKQQYYPPFYFGEHQGKLSLFVLICELIRLKASNGSHKADAKQNLAGWAKLAL